MGYKLLLVLVIYCYALIVMTKIFPYSLQTTLQNA